MYMYSYDGVTAASMNTSTPSLTLNTHKQEGCSTHFVSQSVCQSVILVINSGSRKQYQTVVQDDLSHFNVPGFFVFT